MKNIKPFLSLLIILISFTLGGCELLGDVMEFTMWTTLIVVGIVILLIMWIVRKIRGPRRRY
ncbi:hypothetical protein [Adhaeribacter rhizoryzae]|uniref:Phosphatidate cytidylyltransferase n=1 Tax=Adhaeribacter rhizoryzae TaxID=2607907 RepID=A0A5M6DP76_9BACT|nr:hypothetical protein [Adhaeribacter rhizoryzae]KAA5549288.1 hypothetical protein F0145_01450 [Adhaeribacter rhizoryzae]